MGLMGWLKLRAFSSRDVTGMLGVSWRKQNGLFLDDGILFLSSWHSPFSTITCLWNQRPKKSCRVRMVTRKRDFEELNFLPQPLTSVFRIPR